MSAAISKTHDVMASLGKYNDRETGQEKTRWLKCGALLQRHDGSQVIKLDAIPIEGSGWFALFGVDRDRAKAPTRPPASTESPSAGANPTPGTQGGGFRDRPADDDDIPF